MTLSSMYSPVKNEDKKFLLELAELIGLLVKINTEESLDLAEKFGAHYIALEQKIKTYDYTNDDTFYESFKWTTMSKLNTSPYFTHLIASASPAVKQELEQMEKSKLNSFVSIRSVLKQKYGQPKTNYPHNPKENK